MAQRWLLLRDRMLSLTKDVISHTGLKLVGVQYTSPQYLANKGYNSLIRMEVGTTFRQNRDGGGFLQSY